MRRGVIRAIAIAILTVSVFRWIEVRQEPVARDQPSARGEIVAVPAPRAASSPSPNQAARSSASTTANPPARSVTSDRKRLYDAPDILAGLESIRHDGNADEKDWGLR